MLKRYIPATLPGGSVDMLTVYTPGDNMQVHHLDGDPSNNDPDNLRFVDASENTASLELLEALTAWLPFIEGQEGRSDEIDKLVDQARAAIAKARAA